MKSLRKSLNSAREKDSIRSQISTPLPLPAVSKPPSAILPPQKVIRALNSYRSQAPQELSFQKGDFFYVLTDVSSPGTWYEAHNPVSGARGLVPRSMFEEFNKKSPPIRTSQAGPQRSQQSPELPPARLSKTQVYYAIVMHDFVAERADELDAKSGDAITVVAQSNREWFVAKPIGRLGRPGLIPVSFVEIHDPATGKPIEDVSALIDRGDVPKVEDWKRAMLSYKQNSIALGVIDPPNRDSLANSPYAPHKPLSIVSADPSFSSNRITSTKPDQYNDFNPTVVETPEALPEGILLSADVVSFHYEMDEYWFRINALYQPYMPSGQSRLPSAKQLILFRVYNDFYDFQVSLLETFPREAGRQPPHPRMLPYMPGPAQDVDDALTATRRAELNDYLHSLCDLSRSGAKYILEHPVVREFLSLKPGDVANETEARVHELEALLSRQSLYTAQDRSHNQSGDILRDGLSRLAVHDDGEKDDPSEYEDEGYAPSPQHRVYDRHPYGRTSDRGSNDSSLRVQAHTQSHQRNDSASSFHQHPYASTSRSDSPSHHGDYPSRSAEHYGHHPNQPSVSTTSSSQAATQRSRSHSNATSNMSSPQISAQNPQTAFIKIKIFDRVADDLIAIRVHPRVTHAELMDKVRARLGADIPNLAYRLSSSGQLIELDSDEQLRSWIEATDKHVLFAG